ncbi:DNA polymerase [Heterocapsa circularisquama DNA virus 01]|uniref:DNA polymerase n=1 Tax=Heterocapsa circularisquama DNA virus 01 TaxID=650121 RepID=D0FZR7_HCV01|nr:type B DNA polymerase [Heterocapsa circularisquama DNA virus 01]YP_010774573.1 DNA polymerase [Heterocapsa circularisquama DNA virus 01]BAI48198.1 type B DNA polymerase [Heterocapsa circularisquama DNA virus 01]BAJ12120.1 DNA polymerase [Heterocapsa circularisquama DNA virus 01]
MTRQKINHSICNNLKNMPMIDVENFKKKKLFIIEISQKTCEETMNYILSITCLDNNGNKYFYDVTGIIPCFDIEYNEIVANEIKKYEKILNSNAILNTRNGNIVFEGVHLKPFNYYSNELITHIRLNFKNINNYRTVNNILNKNNIIKEYIRNNETNTNYYNKAIQYNNLINVEKIPEKTLLMTWDIETYSYDKTRIPDGLVESDDCFLICGTFHNYNSDKILSSFAISTINTETNVIGNRSIYTHTIHKLIFNNINNNDINNKIYNNITQFLGIINYPNLTLKICKNEKESIKCFMKMIKEIKPDIITGFNDHTYDWVYIKNKIENYYTDLTRDFYECFNDSKYYTLTNDIKPFISSSVKISADIGLMDINYPKCNYAIFIDTRVEFRKIYPKDIESNLNYYLRKMNLNSKEDLPYKKLFQIYENKDEDGMLLATLYCLTDAYRCQELLVKKQIINEHYNMAYMTGITLKNSICRANGFKVFNYLLKDGIKENYSFIYNKFEKDENSTEYTGGYVADPTYGLNIDCPVIGLDFASLYPNIQRTLNLGPDTLIRDFDIPKYLNSNIPIRKICDKYVVDHNEKENLKSIMVKILTNLFDQRVIIKKKMLMYKFDKEKYSNVDQYKLHLTLCLFKSYKLNNKKINNNIFDYLGINVLNDVINDLDQKQKAVKVLMNSFYGLLGSPTSPLYCKFIAETITKTGRTMLIQVRNYVQNKNYDVHYSDTDSVYVSCNKHIFNDIESKFINNEITEKELFYKKIQITKDEIKVLLNDINKYLKDTYVYSYIKMAYEEVLYPVFFISKKMYFGVEHMETINYDDIDNFLFMRGYSPVRRNTTQLTKNIIVDTVIKQLFSLNTFSIYHKTKKIDIFEIIKNIVFQIVNNFKNKTYPIEYFIKNDRYSPGKKNIRINTFVDKLRQRFDSLSNDELKRKYTPPEPYERFKYVYIDKSNKILYNGSIEKIDGLGNVMEYPCYLDDFNSNLHYKKYFESDLANELGCLIHPKDGKKYIIKLFELFIDNIDNKYELNNIKNIDYDTLIHKKNDIRTIKLKQFRSDAKIKSIEFINIKKDLLVNYPLLFKYDIISNPYTFINNINNDISKINFDFINQRKSDLYKKCYKNEYYKPNLNELTNALNIQYNILYEELDDNIRLYCDLISNELNIKIEEHCNNKETIVDYDIDKSFQNIVSFIDVNKHSFDNLEDITDKYYNIVYKIKKQESYSEFIKKLKKH